MKKILSLMLVAMLLLTTAVWAETEENASRIDFSLEYNSKNTVTVPAGTEIQVDLVLKNEESYKVFTLADEIEFDETFFDYIGEITAMTDKVSAERQSYTTDGLDVIKVMGSYTTAKTYGTAQHLVSFKLRVKAGATGFGVVKSDPDTVMVCGNSNYATKNTDLTIIIGDGTVEQRVLSFDTNGGNAIAALVKEKGETVNLSAYTPVRDGYTFDGWYTDNDTFLNKVTSIVLDDNTTVYAKWTKIPTGGGGGGGGFAVPEYTLTFETNGGTPIDTVSKTKNTTVDLSQYNTQKEGFRFDGWYTDKALTQRVTEITMTANLSVYAKWSTDNSDNISDSSGHKPSIFTDKHDAYIVGREGGFFYPDDDLTRAETAEILYRLLTDDIRTGAQTTENKFEDVPADEWFNTSVSTLANLGIINGRTAELFAPNEPITRAEFTAMLVRVSDLTYSGEDMFADISNHWANAYINNAASANWVNGENGFFRPDDKITRAEAVTLLNRVLNRLPESEADLLDDMTTPPDNNDKTAWYYLAVQEAVNGHIYQMKADGIHETWTELLTD